MKKHEHTHQGHQLVSRVLTGIEALAEEIEKTVSVNNSLEAYSHHITKQGSAVVADEVRVLAQLTHQSAEDIDKVVADLNIGGIKHRFIPQSIYFIQMT